MTPRTPRTGLRRAGAIAVALCAGLATLTACSGDDTLDQSGPVPAYRLVAFNSCDDAINQLRSAAKEGIGPYGFGGAYTADGSGGALGALPPNAAQAQPLPQSGADSSSRKGAVDAQSGSAGTPEFSGTNNQEAGVDEPDLVKTDGRRIVVVHGGVLRIVDAASRQVTGSVSLTGSDDMVQYGVADLLIAGDHALVLVNGGYGKTMMPTPGGPPQNAVDDGAGTGFGGGGVGSMPGSDPGTNGKVGPTGTPVVAPIMGPRLILVDLAGSRVLSQLRVDGAVLDARQTGSIARVVVTSSPRIAFPMVSNINDNQRTNVNKQIIDQAGLERWLPRIEVTTGGAVSRPQINCDAISRPTVYSGTNMLTVLSLDLARPDLSDPQPVSIVADGQTVYSDGASLYVATDLRWRNAPVADAARSADSSPAQTGTTIYQFDTSKAGRPTFVGGGGVPGYLINQYAMSARGGFLRVATTSGNSNWESSTAVTSQSGVYVLRPDGPNLTVVGKVEGLGKGEKIYAVRFLDAVAYVVTFKQTDPLYTVDLTDPVKPRVRGALKINGYSSYLHPMADGRLIGIGQDVNSHVQATGTQVSLFDVSNLDNPSRLGVFTLPGGHSEAEFDPHAFLYWPATGLLVVPMNSVNTFMEPGGGTTRKSAESGALVLRISGTSISQVGFIAHPSTAGNGWYSQPIRRSLVIGSTLWTVSDGGLMASDLSTLQQTGWIALA